MSEQNTPETIHAKLQSIMAEVPHMTKDGHNTSQNYNYLSETQVTEIMKDLLTKHRVIFKTGWEITSVIPTLRQTQFLTTVKVTYQFIDSETGSSIRGVAYGQGTDANDKGVYKAVTGAIKYIFMKNFLIPTGDDPEATNDTPAQADVAFPD